jgi:hypothetical protein
VWHAAYISLHCVKIFFNAYEAVFTAGVFKCQIAQFLLFICSLLLLCSHSLVASFLYFVPSLSLLLLVWRTFFPCCCVFYFLLWVLNSYDPGLYSRYSNSLRAGGSGSRITVGTKFWVPSRPAPRSTLSPLQWVPGPSPGVKRPEGDANFYLLQNVQTGSGNETAYYSVCTRFIFPR